MLVAQSSASLWTFLFPSIFVKLAQFMTDAVSLRPLALLVTRHIILRRLT